MSNAKIGALGIGRLCDNAPIGICLLDRDLRIVQMNRRLAADTGLDATEQVGRPIRDVDPDLGPALQPLCRKVIETAEEVVETELPVTAAAHPRSTTWWQIRCHPVEEDDGVVAGVAVYVLDVTARKLAEDGLRSRLELETKIANISARFIATANVDAAIDESMAELGRSRGASRVYLFRFDLDRAVMDNTHEWCAAGVSPQKENLQGLPFNVVPWWMAELRKGEIIHIKDVSALPPEAAVERQILESQEIKSLVVLPLRVGGELSGFLGFDNVMETGAWSDRDVQLLRVFSEIVGSALERHRTERTLRENERRYRHLADENARLLERARQDGETKSTLLQEVNHRVKNNLTSIIGLLRAEERFAGDTDARQLRETVRRLASRVEGLAVVHRLLSDAGWSTLRLGQVVDEVARLALRSLAPGTKVEIRVTPAPVMVDPQQASSVTLVVNELGTNSVKHAFGGRPSGRITIEIETAAGKVFLRFRDDGPGYPEAVLDGRSRGVGLYLVENIVRNNLRGDLRLDNDGGALTEIVFAGGM